MHFIDPASGCSTSVGICVDGATCHEYKISGGAGNQQCWIAVEADQVLSIQCNIGMIARKHQVDLIIDGILRNTWLSGRLSAKTQVQPALIDFSKGIYKDSRSILECRLRTSSLRLRTLGLAQGEITANSSKEMIDLDNSRPSTIGTIQIQVSKDDDSFLHRQTAPLPNGGEKGRNDLSLTLGTPSVPPTHMIKCDLFNLFFDSFMLTMTDLQMERNSVRLLRIVCARE